MSSRAIQNLFACYSDQLKNTKQPLKNLKAIDALTHCRTRVLGASYYRCKLNHAEIEQLHSCRHRSCYVCAHKQRLEWVIPPFITGFKSRYQATMANFCLGVMPPSPILGRSLL